MTHNKPLVFTAILIAACTGAPRPETGLRTSQPVSTEVAVATFDSLWSKVANTYVDTAFVTSEWAAVRDSLRPFALQITERDDLESLLARALKHIPDSHFYLIPARVATDDQSAGDADGRGRTGLLVRAAEGSVVVWRVEDNSPAKAAGFVPGQKVTRIGAKDVDVSLDRIRSLPPEAQQRALADLLHSLNGALTPAVGDTVKVWIARAGASAAAHSLIGIPGVGRVSQFGNLPPIAGLVKSEKLPTTGGCAGVIAFNIWLPALGPDLEEAVDSVRSCKGIIVDLRGNPGGVGAMVMGFGGYFVKSTSSLGTMKTRQVSLNFVINPRGSRADGTAIAPYSGPLAIIVDPMTASTSEIFATGMQRLGRARVFGERSAGAALPALMERLPSGDVFVHAVADFTDPSGKRVEGAGVVPDEIIPLTVADLKSGKDAPVDAAVKWIGSVAGGGSAPREASRR
jgi:carboxyl-terminal processing protease